MRMHQCIARIDCTMQQKLLPVRQRENQFYSGSMVPSCLADAGLQACIDAKCFLTSSRCIASLILDFRFWILAKTGLHWYKHSVMYSRTLLESPRDPAWSYVNMMSCVRFDLFARCFETKVVTLQTEVKNEASNEAAENIYWCWHFCLSPVDKWNTNLKKINKPLYDYGWQKAYSKFLP